MKGTAFLLSIFSLKRNLRDQTADELKNERSRAAAECNTSGINHVVVQKRREGAAGANFNVETRRRRTFTI